MLFFSIILLRICYIVYFLSFLIKFPFFNLFILTSLFIPHLPFALFYQHSDSSSSFTLCNVLPTSKTRSSVTVSFSNSVNCSNVTQHIFPSRTCIDLCSYLYIYHTFATVPSSCLTFHFVIALLLFSFSCLVLFCPLFLLRFQISRSHFLFLLSLL